MKVSSEDIKVGFYYCHYKIWRLNNLSFMILANHNYGNKMSCQISGCKFEVDLICKFWKEVNYFCYKHGIAHPKTIKHKLETFTEADLSNIFLKSLKKNIKGLLAQLPKESEIVIIQINKACQFPVASLKAVNKNITTISNFKTVVFNQNTIQRIQNQAARLVVECNKFGASKRNKTLK